MSYTIEQMREIQRHVYALLRSHPELRDNDELLIMYVEDWKGYAELVRSHVGMAYLIPQKTIIKRKLVPFSTISRLRRKLQEQYPELRSERYEHKHETAEEMRKNMPKFQVTLENINKQ